MTTPTKTSPPEEEQGTPARPARRRRAPASLRLTDRDIDILVWVTRHGIVSQDQIARKFFPPSQRKSYPAERVQRLCTSIPPFLRRDLTHYREPSVLRVTTHGARIVDDETGIRLSPARLVPAEIHHALGIVDLAEELYSELIGGFPAKDKKDPDDLPVVLLTERERRAQRYREKRAGQRKTTGRIPDAVFIIRATAKQKERTVAVELDRTARSRMDAETVVKAYLSERYTEVWWYVRPARVDAVRQITKRMRTDDFIEVRPWVGQ